MNQPENESQYVADDARVEVKRVLAGEKAPLHVEPSGFVWSVLSEDGYLVEVKSPHRTVVYISDSQLAAANESR